MWYGRAARCWRRSHKLPRLLAVLAGFLLVLGAPATCPAQSPGVGGLQQKQAALAAESQAAVVQLYGLESRLAQARRTWRASRRAPRRSRASRRASAGALRAAQRTTCVRGAASRRPASLPLRAGRARPDRRRARSDLAGGGDRRPRRRPPDRPRRRSRCSSRPVPPASRLATVQRELAGQVRADEPGAVDVSPRRAAGLEQARAERSSYLAGLRREQQLTAAQISTPRGAGAGGAAARAGGDPHDIDGRRRPTGRGRDDGGPAGGQGRLRPVRAAACPRRLGRRGADGPAPTASPAAAEARRDDDASTRPATA